MLKQAKRACSIREFKEAGKRKQLVVSVKAEKINFWNKIKGIRIIIIKYLSAKYYIYYMHDSRYILMLP